MSDSGDRVVVEEQRYLDICTRLREGCRALNIELTYPPATEDQLRATERELEFPIPPLLRAIYQEVANGGNGLIWYDEEWSLVGASGGYPLLGVDQDNPTTLSQHLSRSKWRLHPRIVDALRSHRHRWVYCDEWPEGFIELAWVGPGIALLDTFTGHIYQGAEDGDPLLIAENHAIQLRFLQFYRESLEDWINDWLSFMDVASPDIPQTIKEEESEQEPGELTPDMVHLTDTVDERAIWHGLYRGVEPLIWRDDSEAPTLDNLH